MQEEGILIKNVPGCLLHSHSSLLGRRGNVIASFGKSWHLSATPRERHQQHQQHHGNQQVCLIDVPPPISLCGLVGRKHGLELLSSLASRNMVMTTFSDESLDASLRAVAWSR